MDQILATESLLPWLDPESSKIYLKVSASGAGSTLPDFPLVDTSSPLARLIPAAFTLDARQSIRDVFLLMQKDQYSFSETQVPFSNRDIDALWQQTGKAASFDDGGPFSASLLATATSGLAAPLWRSLLYCLHRQRFFHPPCPRCGKLLELCAADEVLRSAGLPAYSASLQRFLFCPSCQSAIGQNEFFTFAASDTAAPLVKNRRILIDEFASLVENNVAVTGFPCLDCRQSGECYGADRQAAARILPFAFYPFRMIVTQARQLHAGDFLCLLAGASTDELTRRLAVAGLSARAACLKALDGRKAGRIVLFFQDARRFLEVLYLKLALLAQVSSASFTALSHLQHADLRLTIDQFWVDFADYEGPLPHFWNFRVKPLAIGLTPPEGSAFLKVPESLAIRSLSLLWFNVLLANSRVGAGEISRTLADLYGRDQTEKQPNFLAATDSCPLFSPAHIFWQPASQKLPAAWLALWQQALALGWSLLRQSCQPVSDFSTADFSARLTSLAQEVQQNLFAVEAMPVVAMAREESDAAIRSILLGIRQKWETELPAKAPEEEVAEPVPVVDEEQAPELLRQEELEKTVLLSANQLAALMQQESQSAKDRKTDVTDDERPPAGGKPGKTGIDEEADLEKTVIMSADAFSSLPAGRNAETPAPALGGGEEAGPAKPQLTDAAEEGLSETVMINPKQLEALRKMKKNDK